MYSPPPFFGTIKRPNKDDTYPTMDRAAKHPPTNMPILNRTERTFPKPLSVALARFMVKLMSFILLNVCVDEINLANL